MMREKSEIIAGSGGGRKAAPRPLEDCGHAVGARQCRCLSMSVVWAWRPEDRARSSGRVFHSECRSTVQGSGRELRVLGKE